MPPNRILRCLGTGFSSILNIDKTGVVHEFDLISHGDHTAYSLGPCLKTSRQVGRQLLVKHHIGNLKPSAGLEHPVYFGKKLGFGGRKVDDAIGNHHVERAIRKRQLLGFNMVYLYTVTTDSSQIGSRSLYHLGTQVNATNPALGPRPAAGNHKIKTRTTANIKNIAALRDLSKRKGIAHAAKGIEHIFGNLLKQLIIVAQRSSPCLARLIVKFAFGRYTYLAILPRNGILPLLLFLAGKYPRLALILCFDRLIILCPTTVGALFRSSTTCF